MFAPVTLFLLLVTIFKAIGAMIVFMVKAGWWGLAMLGGLIFLGVLAYEIRYILLGIVLGTFAVIAFVWTRYWLVQTMTITTAHVIVYSKWSTKDPWIIPLPISSEISGSYSGPAKALAWTRLVGLGWGALTYKPSGAGTSRVMTLMRGAPGVEVLAGIFPLERVVRQQLPPPK